MSNISVDLWRHVRQQHFMGTTRPRCPVPSVTSYHPRRHTGTSDSMLWTNGRRIQSPGPSPVLCYHYTQPVTDNPRTMSSKCAAAQSFTHREKAGSRGRAALRTSMSAASSTKTLWPFSYQELFCARNVKIRTPLTTPRPLKQQQTTTIAPLVASGHWPRHSQRVQVLSSGCNTTQLEKTAAQRCVRLVIQPSARPVALFLRKRWKRRNTTKSKK